MTGTWIDALGLVNPKDTGGELVAYTKDVLRFQTGCLGERNLVIEIPILTFTDFASIPWAVRWLIAKFGLHARSAVFHDYLFQSGILTWSESNLVMLEIMKIDGVGFFTRQTIYRGLRVGSYPTWRSYRSGRRKAPVFPVKHMVPHERPHSADGESPLFQAA